MSIHDDVMRRLGQPNVPDLQDEIARLRRELEKAKAADQGWGEIDRLAREERDRVRLELEAERVRVADLRRIANVNGDWTLRVSQAESRLAAATALLREALAAHDQARQVVKAFTDAERGGDYMVADAEWATRARALLGEADAVLGKERG